MPVSEQTFKQVALEDPEGQWELHCGRLRSKPGMTEEHNDLAAELAYLLRHQLKRSEYRLRINAGHVRRSETSYYIPDVTVLPADAALQQRGTGKLETYSVPLPLVIEIWSRSTGDYDVRDKLPEYRQRGDLEIWFIHPYDKTLTAWRRQQDGSYREEVYRGGVLSPVTLPDVTIDLDALFEEI